MRSLIADLNDAYCLELRRTAIGPFEVRDAVAPPPRGEPWRDPPLIALEQALAMLARQGGRAYIDCETVKVTRLPDVERQSSGAASRWGPSTACTSATAR